LAAPSAPPGAGATLGLDGAQRASAAALAALAEGTGALELRAALAQSLSDLWRSPLIVAPTGAVQALQLLPALLQPGDVVFAAPEVLTRQRQAASALREAGWTVVSATPETLVAALGAADAPGGCWYVADSAQPRDGRLADLDHLWAVLARVDGLRLWLDDTFGLGWHGRGGRGLVLEEAPARARVVMSAELAPAFGAEAAVIASPQADWLAALEAALPAAEGSAARLAAAGALMAPLADGGAKRLQARLSKRLQVCDRLLKAHRLPQLTVAGLPHRYVAMGSAPAAHAMVAALLESGFMAATATLATPQGPMPAVRLAVTLAQPIDGLQGLVEAMAVRFEATLAAAGVSAEALRAAHGLGAPVEAPTMVDLDAWRSRRLSGPRDSRMRR
jgi:7-keto-8-aminopelargonate synthetase-like enzyme